MIWLNKKDANDREFITCNMLVLTGGQLKVVEEFKKELMDGSKYVLSNADIVYVDKELPNELNNGNERIENQFVGRDIVENSVWMCDNGNIYVRRCYSNLRKNCLEILSQINLSKNEQMGVNIDLLKMLNNDLKQISIIENLLLKLSYLGKDEIRFIINNLWQDFYFFSKEILNVFDLDEVCRYDFEDLRTIKNLCVKNNIQDNCSDILVYSDVADTNSKILKLAKELNEKEKWWDKK